ncbi:MAG: lysophospholipid acyltransferase family protein [Bradymonadaceae bacterium]
MLEKTGDGGELEERLEELFLEQIDDDVWERIRTLDAGQNEYGYDPFGFEPEFLKYVIPFAQFLYRTYFRTEAHGLDRIPDSGRVLLVANHTGQIPMDGLIVASACLLDRRPPRMARSMIERWAPEVPFASYFLARCGQVVGTRENCRLLLDRGGCILVFPEGVGGINKTFERAYELQEFGLGFMRLALENDTPIVPIGVVGGEEQMPAIWNVESVAKLLGMPSFPVTPTWPLLGPAGAIPLPTKYHVLVGDPMTFEGEPDDEDRTVRRKVDRVKSAIHDLIETGLRERRGVFF